MCALYGIHDYSSCFNSKQKNIILTVLSIESETRGIDATGISYVKDNKLQVYKRPVPAHRMRYNLPPKTKVVMGHTRMTTQGNEERNYNNHPFFGRVKDNTFALAHNGILHGEKELRLSMNLPKTNIETDTYIAVQIIEKENSVSFDSLRKMSETVRGSFVFTVLDKRNNLYFVRGDNPLCVYHFSKNGFYLYASTEEILQKSIVRLGIEKLHHHRVPIEMGDILRIDSTGDIDKSTFKPVEYYSRWYGYYPQYEFNCDWNVETADKNTAEYKYWLAMLKQTARLYGYTNNDIDELIAEGWTLDEIENFLYESEDEIIFDRVAR